MQGCTNEEGKHRDAADCPEDKGWWQGDEAASIVGK